MKVTLKDKRKERNGEEAGKALIQTIEDNLEMSRWKFHPAFKNFVSAGNLKIIYDSEWCRIRFRYSRDRPNLPKYDELSIYYGRLHAPNEVEFIVWQGKKCWCWHDALDSLRFLDGLSPAEAVRQEKVHGSLPLVANNFWESELGKNLRQEFPPQFTLVMQSMLWQHYGQRLFELFDMRRPSLWDQFEKFNAELHRLKGTKSYFDHPPRENIC